MVHNLYLYPAAMSGDTKIIINGLTSLFLLDYDGINLHKNKNIYSSPEILQILEVSSQEIGFIINKIESMKASEAFQSLLEMDSYFKLCNNGFLGINFEREKCANNKTVFDKESLNIFKENKLFDQLTHRNFWENKMTFFPSLYFSDEVRDQIKMLGDSKAFSQIIQQLTLLNDFANDWKNGDFCYKELNSKTSLTCSPESKLTLDNFAEERKFKLPNGDKEVFDLHLKTGDFRFHFYPLNESFEVVVGYIGPHLNTWTG